MRVAASALAGALATSLFIPAALAQSADKPLGEILEAITAPPAEAPPPIPPRTPPPRPFPTDGIATTTLPPSQIPDLPVADDAPPFEPGAETEAEAEPPPEPTEAERLKAEAEAAEQARLTELDRRRSARLEAARQAQEEALVDYQRVLAERQAQIEQAQADYQAALERTRLQAERDRADWQARVRACEAGDRARCFDSGAPPR